RPTRSAPPHGPGEHAPPRQKTEPAQRRDGAERAHSREGQRVDAPREDDDPRDEEPAGDRGLALRPSRDGPRDGDERQGVVHVIARPGLEDGEHVRLEAGAQRVRAERAGRDGDPREERTERKEDAIHGGGRYTHHGDRSTAPTPSRSRLTVTGSRPRARSPAMISGTASAVGKLR